jgi:hypothetical protein
MKIISRLTYCGVLLLAGCLPFWGQEYAKPAQITLCELYSHPEQYNGKMIKVRGGSLSELRIENIVHDLPTEPCPTYMRIIVVLPDQVKPAPDFQLVRDESYKKLQQALHDSVPIRIDATYEGRFDVAFVWRDRQRIRVGQDEVKGYGKKHEYDARIVLRQVSDVWAMPIPRR